MNSTPRLPELPLSGRELTGLLSAVLAKGASLRFRAKGASMSPFIKNGDVVTVAPVQPANLRSGHISAFTHPGTDRLAIHRIVGARNGLFLLKGDNVPETDGWIPVSQVLGCVTRVERNGRKLRLGLGPERRLIALSSRTGLLNVALAICGAGLSACRRAFARRPASDPS